MSKGLKCLGGLTVQEFAAREQAVGYREAMEKVNYAKKTVWVTQNKTTSLIFSTEQGAQKFLSYMGGSVAGGFSITPVDVIDA